MYERIYVILDDQGTTYRATSDWSTVESILTENPDYTVDEVRVI